MKLTNEQKNRLLRDFVTNSHDWTLQEEYVCRMLFGLGADRQLTLQETGGLVGYTPQHIRHIEQEAIYNIRKKLGKENVYTKK